MLPEAQRLRRSAVFARAYAAKRAVSNQLLTLYVLERQPASSAKYPHVGFVVSKKVSAKAVVRNRLRRQCREAYRQLCLRDPGMTELVQAKIDKAAEEKAGNQDLHKVLKNQSVGAFLQDLTRWYALVFVVQEGAIDTDFKRIAGAVIDCLQKANRKYGKQSVSPAGNKTGQKSKGSSQ